MFLLIRITLLGAFLAPTLWTQSRDLRFEDLDVKWQLPIGWEVGERREEVGRNRPYFVAESESGSSFSL